MFNITEAYINALTEGKNKFNDMEEVTLVDLEIENIPLLYECEYDLEIKDMGICDECGTVIDTESIINDTRKVDGYEDYWDYYRGSPEQRSVEYEEEYEACPICGYGEDEDETFEYTQLFITDLFEKDLKGLEDYTGTEFVKALNDFKEQIKKQESLTESTKLTEQDDENYTKLKEITKSEMFKFLKKNGLDIENLVKMGVELKEIKPAIDNVLDNYVSSSIAEYENDFNIGLEWDYAIENNDIKISINNM